MKKRLVVDLEVHSECECDKPAEAVPATTAECRPARDWSYVWWYGVCHWLTPQQAKAVQELWKDWQEGGSGLHQSTILRAAGSRYGKLGELFRGHSAWGTMIQPCARNGGRVGCYHLAAPSA